MIGNIEWVCKWILWLSWHILSGISKLHRHRPQIEKVSETLLCHANWLRQKRNCWFPNVGTKASQSCNHEFPVQKLPIPKRSNQCFPVLESMLPMLGTVGSQSQEYVRLQNAGTNALKFCDGGFPIRGNAGLQRLEPIFPSCGEHRLPKVEITSCNLKTWNLRGPIYKNLNSQGLGAMFPSLEFHFQELRLKRL